MVALVVETSRQPSDGAIPVEHVDEVVRDVITADLGQIHVHGEDLPGGSDRIRGYRVANPIPGSVSWCREGSAKTAKTASGEAAMVQ